jgi:hypothetical protein
VLRTDSHRSRPRSRIRKTYLGNSGARIVRSLRAWRTVFWIVGKCALNPCAPRCSSALRSLFGCVWTRNHRSFPSSAKVLSAQNANAIPSVPLASVGLPTKLPHLLIVRPPSPAEFTCGRKAKILVDLQSSSAKVHWRQGRLGAPSSPVPVLWQERPEIFRPPRLPPECGEKLSGLNQWLHGS